MSSGAHWHKRVLVVEDEATLRGIFAEALRESGWTVQTAANGVEAIEVLHHWIPNVIVLDLMMPRLDGEGFTQLMRLNTRFADIPIVLVTAAYKPVEAGVRLGAHAVLRKPFELEHLIETVTQVGGPPSALPVNPRGTPAHQAGESTPLPPPTGGT